MKIIVRTQFEDAHRWPEAPEEVAFLRYLHRHIFFVEIKCEVTTDNRELEFFMVKKELNKIIKKDIITMPVEKSCEMMALKLQKILQFKYKRPFTVSIFEDNENGCEV
jgi:hypothetical protein